MPNMECSYTALPTTRPLPIPRPDCFADCIPDKCTVCPYSTPTLADSRPTLFFYNHRYLANILVDSLGYAGAKMTRRVVGIAHVADLEAITDPDVKAVCERAALRCARRLVLEADKLTSIEDVTAVAESSRAFV
jgi:hypothetical protein